MSSGIRAWLVTSGGWQGTAPFLEPGQPGGRLDSGAALAVSAVVPAYGNVAHLRRCLAAVRSQSVAAAEIIVVDDASREDLSGSVGDEVRFLRLPRNAGPAAARNQGARLARGDVLLFVDSDVVVPPTTVKRIEAAFRDDPNLAAIFGSYDAQPSERTTVSQYRNLLHHYVHQTANREASTFWAGCGAIRRDVFQQVGGFDERRYRRSSIEDIELGYRLRTGGHRVRLDPSLQVTHLKRWTLASMLATDVGRRAFPWSQLILERGQAPDDLNLRVDQRISVALTALAAAGMAAALYRPLLGAVSAAALLGVVALNRQLFRFLWRERGGAFAAACIPLHFLHCTGSAVGFAVAWLTTHGRAARGRSRPLGRRIDVG
jgi:hypothetical protein